MDAATVGRMIVKLPNEYKIWSLVQRPLDLLSRRILSMQQWQMLCSVAHAIAQWHAQSKDTTNMVTQKMIPHGQNYPKMGTQSIAVGAQNKMGTHVLRTEKTSLSCIQILMLLCTTNIFSTNITVTSMMNIFTWSKQSSII